MLFGELQRFLTRELEQATATVLRIEAQVYPRPWTLGLFMSELSLRDTRVYVVAADGRTMEETVAYFGPDGQPVMRRNFFTRLP